MRDYTSSEMMTIAAARALNNNDVCFVGIGAPSAAWLFWTRIATLRVSGSKAASA